MKGLETPDNSMMGFLLYLKPAFTMLIAFGIARQLSIFHLLHKLKTYLLSQEPTADNAGFKPK